jgi:integrase
MNDRLMVVIGTNFGTICLKSECDTQLRQVPFWVDLGKFAGQSTIVLLSRQEENFMQHPLNHYPIPMPWNKGLIMGQKPPLKRSEVWAIRVRLQIAGRARDLAMFNLAIDSKLRACDLVRLRVRDVAQGSQVARRAIIMQRKTRQPVQFEITEQTRAAVYNLIVENGLGPQDYLFSSLYASPHHISTRQYAELLKGWVASIGLDPAAYGTHSLRRTKATLIYRRTKNLRAVQLLLGHTKLESTVQYPGIELDDALEIAEQTEI